MASSSLKNARVLALEKFFQGVIQGSTSISKRTHQFLESIYTQSSPSSCVARLVQSSHGLSALQTAMSADTSPAFYNGDVAKLLKYLSSPELLSVGEGSMLKQIISVLMDPSTFWVQFVEAFSQSELDESGKFGFAWLCYHSILFLPHSKTTPMRSKMNSKGFMDLLMGAKTLETRNIALQINHCLENASISTSLTGEPTPGGRHDNDFADFRKISIVPTADEIRSTLPITTVSSSHLYEGTKEQRMAAYLENQFRLLREDMLSEIREGIQLASERSKYRTLVLNNLRLADIHYKHAYEGRRAVQWAVVFEYPAGLRPLRNIKEQGERKEWLQNNRNFLRHLSTFCLYVEDELVALTTIERDEDLLAAWPCRVVVHIEGSASIARALVKLKVSDRIKLVQVNSSIFAYQPILCALQQMVDIPHARELLFWTSGMEPRTSNSLHPLVANLRGKPGVARKAVLSVGSSKLKEVVLDKSQVSSLHMGLTQTVSLIQGPPGTGKSFIGALLAKCLLSERSQRILVVCYTNHALDQFLEDLLDIGIEENCMIRLGGKFTERTRPFSLQTIQSDSPSLLHLGYDPSVWSLRQTLERLDQDLCKVRKRYSKINPSHGAIMQYLRSNGKAYYDAFTLPSLDGEVVTKKGKKLGPYFLLNNWMRGWGPGPLKDHAVVKNAADIWSMRPHLRHAKLTEWKEAIVRSHVASIVNIVSRYNDIQSQLEAKESRGISRLLQSKRIIACTTTAAAKYRDQIKGSSPSVLLVEEAGEILESHILTALSPSIQKLILVGDHKQLRPRLSNYSLSVESGEGFDLNRSLFERLVLKEYPHQTLSKQYRMRPEISSLIRHLTYPDLVDGAGTFDRPNIRGLQDNVVFITHSHPEDDNEELGGYTRFGEERSTKSSKRNTYEVSMVLKTLRYLLQQEYDPSQIVILTGYLGQLRALQQALKEENDPVLNELDYADLNRAGLGSSSGPGNSKRPIRLATIDNYQGEESDIVIVSLTRSNPNQSIGFMRKPERLNVLLSRARNGLIIVGNGETFLGAKGEDNIWSRFFELLRKGNHIYDGLPVKCELHPNRTTELRLPEDFDKWTPYGGCNQTCGILLACGVHPCPSTCHPHANRSKVHCQQAVYETCPFGHVIQRSCSDEIPESCSKCIVKV